MTKHNEREKKSNYNSHVLYRNATAKGFYASSSRWKKNVI